MLKIDIPASKLKKLLDTHCDALAPKLRTRLNRTVNSCLQPYFTTDILIKEVLAEKPENLVALRDTIINSLLATTPIGDINDAFIRVFNAGTFFKKNTPNYNAFDLCSSLGLMTCPYCNINFINTIQGVKPRELILRPPLDHFYSFELNPLFGLSFFNLIPSCWICNSTFKHRSITDTSTHLNPYVAGFSDNCVFSFTGYKKIEDISSKKGEKFDIVLNNKIADARFNGNIDLFKLETVYNEFKPVAKITFIAATYYPKEQIESIINISRSSKVDAYQMIFNANFNEKELHQSPFSKIKRDLVKEFGSAELKNLLRL